MRTLDVSIQMNAGVVRSGERVQAIWMKRLEVDDQLEPLGRSAGAGTSPDARRNPSK
jgi:hypothetical protein